jgi:hypothetical protein
MLISRLANKGPPIAVVDVSPVSDWPGIIVGPEPHVGFWTHLWPFEHPSIGVPGISVLHRHKIVDGSESSGLKKQATFVGNFWGGTAKFQNLGMPYDAAKETEVIAIVKGYVAALNDAFVGPNKDTKPLRAMMAEDANVEFPLGTPRVSGKKDIKSYFKTLLVGNGAEIELATGAPEHPFSISPGYGFFPVSFSQQAILPTFH